MMYYSYSQSIVSATAKMSAKQHQCFYSNIHAKVQILSTKCLNYRLNADVAQLISHNINITALKSVI